MAYFDLERLVSLAVERFFVINKDVVVDTAGVVEHVAKSRGVQVGVSKVRVTAGTNRVDIGEVGDI